MRAMAVPTREGAARILIDLRAPRWLRDHSAAVAEVAAFLAERMRERGRDVPPDLAETAALLHDVDKAPPLGALRAALGHGTAGASWLAARGLAELGPAIAGHPATRLADEAEFNRWLREATPTELIVSYADKRAMKDVVPLTHRFAKWQANHPERAATIARGRVLADRLEENVCAAAGISPTDVTRLQWVDGLLDPPSTSRPRSKPGA
jgi:putative nucleotidyltransferase with HDIG domain